MNLHTFTYNLGAANERASIMLRGLHYAPGYARIVGVGQRITPTKGSRQRAAVCPGFGPIRWYAILAIARVTPVCKTG